MNNQDETSRGSAIGNYNNEVENSESDMVDHSGEKELGTIVDR